MAANSPRLQHLRRLSRWRRWSPWWAAFPPSNRSLRCRP